MLDSNVWIAQHGLRSPLGAAILYALRVREGFIGLPEVVELEVRHRLESRAVEVVALIEKGLRQLRQLHGTSPIVDLPSREAMGISLDEWFGVIEPTILRTPLTIEAAQRSTRQVVKGLAPNQNKEQMRDTLIFEAAIELSESHRVVFVSNDKAFFDGEDLHPDLQQLLESRGRALQAVHSLDRCLQILETEEASSELDRELIEALVLEAIHISLEALAENRGFWLGDPYLSKSGIYATEDPGSLAVSFRADYAIEDAEYSADELQLIGLDENAPYARQGETLSVKGSALLRLDDHTVYDTNLEVIELSWTELGTPHRETFSSGSTTSDPTVARLTFRRFLAGSESI